VFPRFFRPRGAPLRRGTGPGCQVTKRGGRRDGPAMCGAPRDSQAPHEEAPHRRVASPGPATGKISPLTPSAAASPPPPNPILISPSFSSRLPHLRSNLPNSNCTKPKQQPPPSINHLLPRTPTQKRPKPGQPKLTNAPNSQTQRNPTSKQTPQRGRKPEQPPNREKRSGRTTNRALMTASRGVQSLTHARGQTRT
jgi:hypothetical protein